MSEQIPREKFIANPMAAAVKANRVIAALEAQVAAADGRLAYLADRMRSEMANLAPLAAMDTVEMHLQRARELFPAAKRATGTGES